MIELGKLRRTDLSRLQVTEDTHMLTAVCRSFGEPTDVKIWVASHSNRWHVTAKVGCFETGHGTFDTVEEAEEFGARSAQGEELLGACIGLSHAFGSLGELLAQVLPMIERERAEAIAAERAAIASEVERRRAARFEAFEARGDCCDYNAEVALLEVCEWLSARSKGEVA